MSREGKPVVVIEFRYFDTVTDTHRDLAFDEGELLGIVGDGKVTEVANESQQIFDRHFERYDALPAFIDDLRDQMLNGVIDPVATIQFRGMPLKIRAGVPTEDNGYVWNPPNSTQHTHIARQLGPDSKLGSVEFHELSKYGNRDTEEPKFPVYKEYETNKSYRTAWIGTRDLETLNIEYVGTLDLNTNVVVDGDENELKELISPLYLTVPTLNSVGLLLANRGSKTRVIGIEDPADPSTRYGDPFDIKRDPSIIIQDEVRLEEIKDHKQNPSFLRRNAPSFIVNLIFGTMEKWEAGQHQNVERIADRLRTLQVEATKVLIKADSLWRDLEYEPNPDKEKIDSMRSELEDFQTRFDTLFSEAGHSPDDRLYLNDSEVAIFSDLREAVDETIEKFSVNNEYERIAEKISESYEGLKDESRPYLEYEKYLRRNEYADLESRFEEFTDLIENVDQLDAKLFPMVDRRRLNSYWQLYDSVTPLVKTNREGYNSKYIEKQADKYADLFNDLGPDGINLIKRQRRAVFRNAQYNQVVAGAGTGKTIVLSSRIAYLLEEGVDSENIIALTFSKKTVKDIEERLSKHYGIDSVEIRTIRSLGYKLLRESDNLPKAWIEGPENFVEERVKKGFEQLSPEGRRHYQLFLAENAAHFLDESKIDTATDLNGQRTKRDYKTLNGEKVKTREEKSVADFLFLHQVQYRYEAETESAETEQGRLEHQAGFFLPKHDTSINHWDFKYHNNDLWENLKNRLKSNDVPMEGISGAELQEKVVDAADERGIIEQLVEFIQKARRNDLDEETINSRLETSKSDQFHFGRVGAELLQQYRTHLREKDRNDFLGMVLRSIDEVFKNAQIRARYDHLLIDEFQEISNPQARLVGALTRGENGPVLFAVGDDWQSIYGFRGGNPSFFIDFEEQFGPQDRAILGTNFRSTPNIVQMGNDVIYENSNQIDKQVSAVKEPGPTPKLHSFGGGEEYVDRSSARAAATAFEYLFHGSSQGINSPGDIMILSRYDTGADYIDSTKQYLRRLNIPYEGYADSGKKDVFEPNYGQFKDSDGKVSIHSIHKAKGEEAECVILLNIATSGQAFPSDEPEDHLLDPVEEKSIDFLEEERRLFYVAITRAEHELHIFTETNNMSPFLLEVSDHLMPHKTVSALREQNLPSEDNGAKRVTVEIRVSSLFSEKHESMAQIGMVEDDTGRIRFVSWESGDPSQMKRGNWYRIGNAKLEEYKGQLGISIDARSDIRDIDRHTGRDNFL